jgi:SAM-dependent methyltransferase
MAPTKQRLEQAFERLYASPCLDGERYGRSALSVFRPRHLAMARAIEKHLAGPRETIADIGCQNGFFLRLSSELGFRRFLALDYFSIPPERSFLTGLEGTEFVKANFNEDRFLAPLGDASVDCVVSTEVFEHIYHHPSGYLAECWRVLRPGGLLLLSTPNPCTLANSVRLTRGQAMSWGGVDFANTPKITPDNGPLAVWDIHFREYAPSELAEIVAELPGVSVVERGFLSSGPDPASHAGKRGLKSLQWTIGLGRWRPLCTTQYMILKKFG